VFKVQSLLLLIGKVLGFVNVGQLKKLGASKIIPQLRSQPVAASSALRTSAATKRRCSRKKPSDGRIEPILPTAAFRVNWGNVLKEDMTARANCPSGEALYLV